MNFDKESKSRIFFFLAGGGGGGGGGGAAMTQEPPYFIHNTYCHNLFYRTSHENIPYGIQSRGHCSFNNQGKITQKV